ncbi:UNVERIFIED_CONTAM: hypothetical protein GTU68_059383 [Idotea baltica]|nr:hypothetical protein [Idotea baltica]
MPFLSSCNIACGAHAGDEKTIARIAKLASKSGVKVGAHPSYPDRENFGRVSLDISSEDLIRSIQHQISTFSSILKKENIELHHIKPHGALYNDMSRDSALAKVFLRAISAYKEQVILYAAYGSALANEAKKNKFSLVLEAFADRNYNENLSLVSRKQGNALICQPKLVLEHIIRIVKEKHVLTLEGDKIPIEAETFCVHSDTPTVLKILSYLTTQLPAMKININR